MRSSGSAKTLIILTLILVVFGLAMLSSAGAVEGLKKFGSSSYYLKHQFWYGVLPGLAVLFAASRINPKYWKKLSLPILFGAVALLVLVFLPQFGVEAKGAQRWVSLGFITFQPSEFLKLALIVYLAAWFSQRGTHAGNWSYSVLPFLLVIGFAGTLLALQPDLKTLTIVALLGGAMYFFSGAKITHLIGFVLIFTILFASLAYFAPYRWSRIMAFWNPQADTLGAAYHTNQALLSVGSGGMFGVGYGQSQQKTGYLPEPVGDSIFAIIAEELGFVGGSVVLGLFVLLILTLIRIAKKTSDRFGKLFLLGLASWIALQAFINVGAIIGIIPMTGVPLPFFSYGSSSLVSLLAAVGIAAGVARKG